MRESDSQQDKLTELQRLRQIAEAHGRAGDVEELDRMIRLHKQSSNGGARLKVFAVAILGLALLIWILWMTDDASIAARPDPGPGQPPMSAAAPAG